MEAPFRSAERIRVETMTELDLIVPCADKRRTVAAGLLALDRTTLYTVCLRQMAG